MNLKDNFTFQYKNKEGLEIPVNVKLMGEVYCAVFGKVTRPLIISYDGHIHLMTTGKLLGFVNIKDITKPQPIKG